MLCERCNLRPATQRVVEVVAGKRREWHLCEECATEVAYGLVATEPQETQAEPESPSAPPPGATLRCPTCGLTYREFLKTLRFGCADCYTAFAENLQVLLKELHGDYRYRGLPHHPHPQKEQWVQELARLHDLLETAVLEEDFERAAELRDQIQTLLEQLGWKTASENR